MGNSGELQTGGVRPRVGLAAPLSLGSGCGGSVSQAPKAPDAAHSGANWVPEGQPRQQPEPVRVDAGWAEAPPRARPGCGECRICEHGWGPPCAGG